MKNGNPTVFVIDDDDAVRSSLRLLFKSYGLDTVLHASAEDFLANYDHSRAGCVVLDVRMPGMSGPELQRHLKETGADLPTIIITGHGDVPVAVRAMKDGALEFLQKPFSTQLLLEHIRAALDRDVERREALARRSSVAARLAALTERERQVMELVVSGKISKEVAAELGISKKTVDVHRARVMQKLQVQSLPELVELVLTQKAGRDSLHPGHRPS